MDIVNIILKYKPMFDFTIHHIRFLKLFVKRRRKRVTLAVPVEYPKKKRILSRRKYKSIFLKVKNRFYLVKALLKLVWGY